MLSQSFLGISLLGAEWVLYLLLIISIASIALIFERWSFYRNANRDLETFRGKVRTAVAAGKWDEALSLARDRSANAGEAKDLEAGLAKAILEKRAEGKSQSSSMLTELAQDQVLRTKVSWEKNLALIGTIGNNAPFVGLFGTVLGIIKAFHDLSRQAAAGAQAVSSGVSEALVATAVGILVAIPAVVAFNLFQRQIKKAMAEAEALKSFLVGQILSHSGN